MAHRSRRGRGGGEEDPGLAAAGVRARRGPFADVRGLCGGHGIERVPIYKGARRRRTGALHLRALLGARKRPQRPDYVAGGDAGGAGEDVGPIPHGSDRRGDLERIGADQNDPSELHRRPGARREGAVLDIRPGAWRGRRGGRNGAAPSLGYGTDGTGTHAAAGRTVSHQCVAAPVAVGRRCRDSPAAGGGLSGSDGAGRWQGTETETETEAEAAGHGKAAREVSAREVSAAHPADLKEKIHATPCSVTGDYSLPPPTCSLLATRPLA